MKKTILFLALFFLFTSFDSPENVKIINDTDLIYKFQFPGEDYSLAVIGVYSEEHREYPGDKLKNISVVEKQKDGSSESYINNEDALATIKNAFVCYNGKWIILCRILNPSVTCEFEKDCDLCSQINQYEVSVTLNNYVYNDTITNISKKAESQLSEIKETLRKGHKFIECGCRDNKVIYRLWCANDETFELEVTVSESNRYIITGIHSAEFSHP